MVGDVFLGKLCPESLRQVQAVLSWLPGYMYVGGTLKSTGGSIPPTFHLRGDGEIMAYVRPIFRDGATVGMFVKMSGVKAAVERGEV